MVEWNMFGYLAAGVTLGLAAGLSPGPLLAFLVAQTLRYGVREGIKVAITPLLTDGPVVVVVLFILGRAANSDALLGTISLAGGVYVVWLGVTGLRTNELNPGTVQPAPQSLRDGCVINLLNPHVYVTWLTVCGPLVLRAARDGAASSVGFVAGFYLLLCGSKALLALLVDRSRNLLGTRAYRRIVQALGVTLIGFGLWLGWSAIHYLTR